MAKKKARKAGKKTTVRLGRRSKMSRLDIMLPKRLRQCLDLVAEDQGCATTSEYVRRIAREDVLSRGFDLNERYPK